MSLDRRTFLAAALSTPLFHPATIRAEGRADAGPLYLNAHSAAFDEDRRSALIFGGADAGRVRNELWEYRYGRLRALSRSGPVARTFAAMARDSRRRRLVVFGGNRVLFGTGGDTLLDDHWEWDGKIWSRFEGARPPGRSEACCVYDPAREKLLLFGGWRFEAGQRIRLDDLWSWDGNEWRRIEFAGPDARSGAAMTWDPIGRRSLLVGGNGGRQDCWTLDGAGWHRLKDLQAPRFNPCLAWDRKRDQAVLFGGWTGRSRIGGTSLFNGRIWRETEGEEPPGRNHSVLVADGSGLLLVGGHNGDEIFGDLWRWDGGWKAVRNAPPVRRIANGH